VVAIQVHADNELICREQMVLVNGDRKLNIVQHGPGFDLDCDVGAVVEPMDHRVYATVEHGQEDMEAPA